LDAGCVNSVVIRYKNFHGAADFLQTLVRENCTFREAQINELQNRQTRRSKQSQEQETRLFAVPQALSLDLHGHILTLTLHLHHRSV
jgi:hypothetical protein